MSGPASDVRHMFITIYVSHRVVLALLTCAEPAVDRACIGLVGCRPSRVESGHGAAWNVLRHCKMYSEGCGGRQHQPEVRFLCTPPVDNLALDSMLHRESPLLDSNILPAQYRCHHAALSSTRKEVGCVTIDDTESGHRCHSCM